MASLWHLSGGLDSCATIYEKREWISAPWRPSLIATEFWIFFLVLATVLLLALGTILLLLLRPSKISGGSNRIGHSGTRDFVMTYRPATPRFQVFQEVWSSIRTWSNDTKSSISWVPAESSAKRRRDGQRTTLPVRARGRAKRVLSASREYAAPGHGDDAALVGTNYAIVADGVGGSASSSAPLARALVGFMGAELKALCSRGIVVDKLSMHHAAIAAIDRARRKCTGLSIGSTLSVAYVDLQTSTLHTLTLGDSKTIVIRDKQVVFETTNVSQCWNVPAIIGTTQRDCAAYLNWERFGVLQGDIILTFSDGVSDNLFVDEIIKCVDRVASLGSYHLAQALLVLARSESLRASSRRPFAVSAAESYYQAVKKASEADVKPSSLRKLKEAKRLLDEGMCADRPTLAKEVHIWKNLEYYNVSQLENISRNNCGKKDDISICCMSIE